MRFRPLPAERNAFLIFVLLFLLTFADAQIYSRFWVLGMLAVALVWIVILTWAVMSVAFAFKDHAAPLDRLRAAIATPIAILAAILFGPLASWSAGLVYLQLHQAEFAAARRAAPAGAAVAISYVQGIPDGGVSIVESPGRRPETLSQTEMIQLTGERIHYCRHLRADYYLCGYD